MRGFKLFLTLPLAMAIILPAVSYAADPKAPEKPPVVIPTEPEAINVPPLSQERVRDYVQSGEGANTPGWAGPPKNQFIGYAWPFTDRDATKDLSGAPIVLELFTTQGCIFCPTADQFFSELIKRVPNVIGLACHVDYLDVRKGSLSMRECTSRQRSYAQTIQNGNVYSPQTVINGRVANFGYSFDEIFWNMKGQLAHAPKILSVTKEQEDDTYAVVIPDLALPKDATAQLDVMTYRKPVRLSISEGVNKGAPMNYERSVSSISSHPVSGKSETLQQVITRKDTDGGAVIMVRSNGAILAVADIKFE